MTAVGCGGSSGGGGKGNGGSDAGVQAGGGGGAQAGGSGSAGGGGSYMKKQLPLVTPPVRAAAPHGFQTGAQMMHTKAGAHSRALMPGDIQSRFFGAGPTDIFQILSTIDMSVTNVNGKLGTSMSACISQTPVAYQLATPGAPVTMYAQCYEQQGDGLMQFAQVDGVTYLFQSGGQEEVAAIVTPTGDDDGGAGGYQVEAWLSVGIANASTSCGGKAVWDNCSYGVIHLKADSSTMQFEMAVAGGGFGYCGAQLKSDGTSVYATGSTDMGMTCNAVDDLCVAASDGMSAATCDAGVMTFALPALGRKGYTGTSQSFGETLYPASGGNVTLDGTSDDSVHFGPTAPTTGAGAFSQ